MKRIPIVIVLILVALVSLLIRPVMRKREDSLRRACMNNQRMIDSMTYNLMLAEKLTNGTQITEQLLRKWHMYPGKWWECPSDGHYPFPQVGCPPSCSVHGELLDESCSATNAIKGAQQKAGETTSDSAPSAESEASQP